MKNLYEKLGVVAENALKECTSTEQVGERIVNALPAWFKNEYQSRIKLSETLIKLDRTKQAANSLQNHMFGNSQDKGIVGSNITGLNVWMRSKESLWFGPRPTEWEGFPVEWRWECGEGVAQTPGKFPLKFPF